MNAQNAAWQRIAVGIGFTPYAIGIEETPGDVLIREKAKENRKIEGLIKSKETRERKRDSIRKLPMEERSRIIKMEIQKNIDKIKSRKKRKMGE